MYADEIHMFNLTKFYKIIVVFRLQEDIKHAPMPESFGLLNHAMNMLTPNLDNDNNNEVITTSEAT